MDGVFRVKRLLAGLFYWCGCGLGGFVRAGEMGVKRLRAAFQAWLGFRAGIRVAHHRRGVIGGLAASTHRRIVQVGVE